MKLLCWNVNGFRAVIRKGFLEWFHKESADIVCLQEVKTQKEQIVQALIEIVDHESYWCSAERKGYSGVATFTKRRPTQVQYGLGIPRFDIEGRVLVTEFPEFTLFNVYFPNGKRDSRRLRYKMEFYEAILEHWQALRESGKKLIICGDYNTAHKEIDLARPKENATVSGFLQVERDWMDKLVGLGYVDVFRIYNPQPNQYTWWDMMTRARERNSGWRIDYFFVTQDLIPEIRNADIRPEVMGSDHCPIGLELEL